MPGNNDQNGDRDPTRNTPNGDPDRAAPRPGLGRPLDVQSILASVESKLFGSSPQFSIGRYTVERELGRGAMGVVYLATDPELERQVAIKVLRTNPFGDIHGAPHRLRREAQAMARLSHPNVVSVFDVGSHQSQVYIAMEYVDGQTLTRWLGDSSHSWKQILEIFVRAGRGLAAAHKAGIVHRDFKPDNILLGDDQRPRVLDFGLAAATANDDGEKDRAPPLSDSLPSSLTQTGAVMGTPAYMSPEPHQGLVADARSDQFSDCVALWIALYRQPPFVSTDLATLRENVLAGKIVSAPKSRGVPPELAHHLCRGLALDPRDRFRQMSELLDALERHLLPSRSRRRGALVVALVAAVSGIVGITLQDPSPGLCADGEQRIAAGWNDDVRAAVRKRAKSALLGTATVEDDWSAEVITALNQYARSWTEVTRTSCAQSSGSNDSVHLRLSCLEWRLQEFEGLTSLLANGTKLGDSSTRHRDHEKTFHGRTSLDGLDARTAVASIASPYDCIDEGRLRSTPAPPDDRQAARAVQALRLQLARIRPLFNLGQVDEAHRRTRTLMNKSEETGYRPLEAEVKLFLGELLVAQGQRDLAVSTLMKAVFAGEASNHQRIVAIASAQLVGAIGLLSGESSRAQDWAQRSAAALERIDGDAEASALLALGLSQSEMTHGRLPEALANAQRAVDLTQSGSRNSLAPRAQLAYVLTLLGRYREARKHAILATQGGNPQRVRVVMATGTLGILELLSGNAERALPYFSDCIRSAAPHRPHHGAYCLSYQGGR